MHIYSPSSSALDDSPPPRSIVVFIYKFIHWWYVPIVLPLDLMTPPTSATGPSPPSTSGFAPLSHRPLYHAIPRDADAGTDLADKLIKIGRIASKAKAWTPTQPGIQSRTRSDAKTHTHPHPPSTRDLRPLDPHALLLLPPRRLTRAVQNLGGRDQDAKIHVKHGMKDKPM